MIRFSGALLLALPAAVVFCAVPAMAQYSPPPRGYYEERLPPVIGGYDDEDLLPPPRRGVRPGQRGRVLPYPDDEPELPPPTGLFGPPDQRPGAYSRQVNPQQLQQAPQGVPGRATNDPDALRPPAGIGAAPRGTPPSVTAALPPDYQPETGQPKELPANLKKQLVDFSTKEPAGTIIIGATSEPSAVSPRVQPEPDLALTSATIPTICLGGSLKPWTRLIVSPTTSSRPK